MKTVELSKRMEVIQTILSFPKEFELSDIIINLMYKEDIERGLRELKDGRIVSSQKVSRLNKSLNNYVWTESAYGYLESIASNFKGKETLEKLALNISESLINLSKKMKEEKFIPYLGISEPNIFLVDFLPYSLVLKADKENIFAIAILHGTNQYKD